MKILAILEIAKDIEPSALEADQLAEQQMVWRLYREGYLREIYLREDKIAGAVLIFEGEDVKQIENLVKTLPLVAKKLLTFKLMPLSPFIKLERLWSNLNTIKLFLLHISITGETLEASNCKSQLPKPNDCD